MATGTHRLPERIGRYTVRSKIGAGGVGVVFQAHDPQLDREVAVKLLRPDRFHKSGNESAASERLRREAQTMAKLAHPNVVTVYDVGDHEDSVYIAMELVHGQSLKNWFAETARPWREVLAMFFQAGFGLSAAHQAGIIHRDFKPANVLVGKDNRARVLDFGLARLGPVEGLGPAAETSDVDQTSPSAGRSFVDTDAVEVTGGRSLADTDVEITTEGPAASSSLRQRSDILSTATGEWGRSPEMLSTITSDPDQPTPISTGVTSTGVFVGTPAYMAPELYTGGRADERTDQYAYCVSLYEGLYGERPFAGKTAFAIAEEMIAERVRDVPGRSRVPGWVRNIVMRGLRVKPEDRHPSVKSLLASISFTARIMWD